MLFRHLFYAVAIVGVACGDTKLPQPISKTTENTISSAVGDEIQPPTTLPDYSGDFETVAVANQDQCPFEIDALSMLPLDGAAWKIRTDQGAQYVISTGDGPVLHAKASSEYLTGDETVGIDCGQAQLQFSLAKLPRGRMNGTFRATFLAGGSCAGAANLPCLVTGTLALEPQP